MLGSRPASRPGFFWAALACAFLAGCADTYGRPINGQAVLSPEEQRLQAVETKVADLMRRMNALEGSQLNSQVADDMRNLRGQVEQLRYDVDGANRRAQDQQADLDSRLRRLEGGGAALAPADANAASAAVPGATTAAGQAATAASNVSAAPAANNAMAAAPPASAAADEEAAYLKGFDQLKGGKYDDAIRSFKGMLDKYPKGNFADNGWYWMGESYYVKRDYANALRCYQSLLSQFPASPKVPDGLLKTGIVLQEQQKKDQARAAYQRVIQQFPNSSAAAQARNRLGQLG